VSDPGRREELALRLADVRRRMAKACETAGRDVSELTLVAVTKTRPASDVRLLYELGLTDVGENRDAEAAPKAAQCADLSRENLTWHFIGQLQTNKARSVARYADVVHSVDRAHLVRALDSAAVAAGRRLGCLVQVGLDHGTGRGGAAPEAVPELADLLAAASALELRGLMAVAPLDSDPKPAFERLATLSADLRREHPGAGWISAGMSGDLEAAIAAGATHVRVGSAILGHRAPLR